MSSLNMDKPQVERAVDALLQYLKKKGSSDIFLDESQPINMQLGFKKVPKEKEQMIKIPLPHSLVTSTTDVCLFVKDLDKKNRDFEPTQRHFKELLDVKGVTSIDEVIPLKSLKTEYQPFEAKKNLSTMYDVFLADERIIRLLPGFLGKNFYGKKKFPVQINVMATDLKEEVSKALGTALCSIAGKGSMSQVTIGTTAQTKTQIVDNIITAATKLTDNVAGGSVNIKSLHIKSLNSPSLPVYLSLDSANDVELPASKRQRDFIEPEEVTTVIHGKVRVNPRGNISIVNAATAKTDEDKDFLDNAKKAKKNEKKKAKRPLKEVKSNGVVEDIEVKVKSEKRRKLSEEETPKKTPAPALETSTKKKPKTPKATKGTPKPSKVEETPSQDTAAKKKPKTPKSTTPKASKDDEVTQVKTPKSKDTLKSETPKKTGAKRKAEDNVLESEVEKEVASPKKKKSKIGTPKGKVNDTDAATLNTPEQKAGKKNVKTPKATTPKAIKVEDTSVLEIKTPKKPKTPKSTKGTPKTATPKASQIEDTPARATRSNKKPKTPKAATPKASQVEDTPALETSTKKKPKTPKATKGTPKPSKVEETPSQDTAAKKKPKTPKSATPKASKDEEVIEVKTPKSKDTPKLAKTPKSIRKVDTTSTKKTPKSAKKTPKSKTPKAS